MLSFDIEKTVEIEDAVKVDACLYYSVCYLNSKVKKLHFWSGSGCQHFLQHLFCYFPFLQRVLFYEFNDNKTECEADLQIFRHSK